VGLIRVADVDRQHVSWLWHGRIPYGKLTVLDGDPGLGKSTITLDIAARFTTGSPMPDGSRLDHRGSVVLLSAEDGIGDTIRPRLEAAGADLERVHVFAEVWPDDGPPRPPSLPGDLERLEATIEATGARLVVIDPLSAYLGGSVDAYRDTDIRRALHPMAALAERTSTALLVLRHLSKSGGTNAIYRGGGSIGIIGAARVGLIVARDPEDETGTRCVVAVSKCNIAPLAESLAYRVTSDPERECGVIAWEGTTAHTATSLLAEPASAEERSARDEARDWLDAVLGEGPARAKVAQAAAKEAGIAVRTLRRAADDLGLRKVRRGFGAGSVVWWCRPGDEDAIPDSETPIGDIGDHSPAKAPVQPMGESRPLWPVPDVP
jgi:hypothetical protein